MLLLVGGAIASGCLTATPPPRATRPTLLDPHWRNGAFEDHLDFFRGASSDGTSPKVEGYVRDAMHAAWLQPGVENRYRLWRAPGAPAGYVGYVGGQNPEVAKQAVLVCADLGGARGNAVDAAALLEVARVYGIGAQYTLLPERSVIFALWPRRAGGSPAARGLHAYLRQPTWQLDQVRAVFYMGTPERLSAETQQILDRHGIPLHRVDVPSGERPSGPRPAAAASEANASEEVSETEAAAILHARRLAERTHRRLRAATLTSGEMLPALGDTLRVPSGDEPPSDQP